MIVIETRTGDPIAAGDVWLVPVARSWRLDLGRVGLVWNRPAGVLVEVAGGVTPKGRQPSDAALPIRDWTRRWQLALFAAGLAGSLALWLGRPRRRSLGKEIAR